MSGKRCTSVIKVPAARGVSPVSLGLPVAVNGVPVQDAVLKAWQWQPGWVCLLTTSVEDHPLERGAS
jgi:hypothetical protein